MLLENNFNKIIIDHKTIIMNSKKIKIILFFVLAALLTVTSCSSNDDDNAPPIDQIQIQVENNVQQGTWRITKFIDSGDDETNHFTGYNFTFGSNGSLTAANGSNTFNGTWSVTDSNSNDDSPNDLEFNINFNLTNDFEALNDDWDFVSQSPTKIELIDISGGNGGTDYLTFEKN
jgi:hypothetical protein